MIRTISRTNRSIGRTKRCSVETKVFLVGTIVSRRVRRFTDLLPNGFSSRTRIIVRKKELIERLQTKEIGSDGALKLNIRTKIDQTNWDGVRRRTQIRNFGQIEISQIDCQDRVRIVPATTPTVHRPVVQMAKFNDWRNSSRALNWTEIGLNRLNDKQSEQINDRNQSNHLKNDFRVELICTVGRKVVSLVGTGRVVRLVRLNFLLE